MVKELLQVLIEKNYTLGAAESFTGGGFANTITNVAGSSRVFVGSLVTYHPTAKIQVLHVDKGLLYQQGAVSEECAEAMVQQCKKLLRCDVAVSFTGNAGPSASEGKPVGLVYLGFSTPNHLEVVALQLQGTRKSIKRQSIQYAVDHLLSLLREDSSQQLTYIINK